jgi:hypothetical protein
MRGVFVMMAALLAIENAAAAPVTGCDAQAALWVLNSGNFDRDAAVPAVTRQWSCTVKAITLVIKYQYGHPRYACSAETTVTASAWINGVKIIDKEEGGGSTECLGRTGLSSVSLKADGRARICRIVRHTPYPDDPKERCQSTAASAIKAAKRDPAFVPLERTSKPGFDLRVSHAAYCPSLTHELTEIDWANDNDPAFAGLEIAGTEGWRKTTIDDVYLHDDKGEWNERPRTATIDIDNDGITDVVELYPIRKYHGPVMGELRWFHVGAKPFIAGELLWEQPRKKVTAPELIHNHSSSHIANVIQPIRLNGRNYIYLRRHSADAEGMEWDIGEDWYATSEFGRRTITRGIAELHPDGTTTLVCGWGPRFRPELAL